MMNKDDGYIEMTSDKEHKIAVPLELMNVGHHYDTVQKESWKHFILQVNKTNSHGL